MLARYVPVSEKRGACRLFGTGIGLGIKKYPLCFGGAVAVTAACVLVCDTEGWCLVTGVVLFVGAG